MAMLSPTVDADEDLPRPDLEHFVAQGPRHGNPLLFKNIRYR